MQQDTWIREAKGHCVQFWLALPASLLLPSALSPFSPVCLLYFSAHVPVPCFMVSSAFHAKMWQIDVFRPLCLFWVMKYSHSASQQHSLPVSCSTQFIIIQSFHICHAGVLGKKRSATQNILISLSVCSSNSAVTTQTAILCSYSSASCFFKRNHA